MERSRIRGLLTIAFVLFAAYQVLTMTHTANAPDQVMIREKAENFDLAQANAEWVETHGENAYRDPAAQDSWPESIQKAGRAFVVVLLCLTVLGLISGKRW